MDTVWSINVQASRVALRPVSLRILVHTVILACHTRLLSEQELPHDHISNPFSLVPPLQGLLKWRELITKRIPHHITAPKALCVNFILKVWKWKPVQFWSGGYTDTRWMQAEHHLTLCAAIAFGPLANTNSILCVACELPMGNNTSFAWRKRRKIL